MSLLAALFLPNAHAFDAICRWSDLAWSHDLVELHLVDESFVFARLRAGATVDGRLGTVDDRVRLRLSTTGPVRVTGDHVPGDDLFRASETSVDFGRAVLTSGNDLRVVDVEEGRPVVEPVLWDAIVWTPPLRARVACDRLNLLPIAPAHGERALAEAGHEVGEPYDVEGPLDFLDEDGAVMVRLTGDTMRVYAGEQRKGRTRVVVETNGLVWSSWVPTERLVALPETYGSIGMRGGGGSSSGSWSEVPMKTVKDARCPERALWFSGRGRRAKVGTVTDEQVLRVDQTTDAGVRVVLHHGRLEPVDGHFEVETLEGCSIEETQIPDEAAIHALGVLEDEVEGLESLGGWSAMTEADWRERARKLVDVAAPVREHLSPKLRMRWLGQVGRAAENGGVPDAPFYGESRGQAVNIAWTAAACFAAEQPEGEALLALYTAPELFESVRYLYERRETLCPLSDGRLFSEPR